jgi:hypothetical protein
MAASTNNLTGAVALPKFYYSTDGGSTYTQVAQLRGEPSVGEPTTDVHELTNTDITDGCKTKTWGWTDEGEASFEALYREDTLQNLRALMRQDLDFKVEWTDPAHSTTDSKWTFGGCISAGPTPVTPMEGEHTITFTIAKSGQSTLTIGT